MKYLFQVSIGPVQGFITSARRTRDLAFGSWLLSELAKAAALQIVKSEGLNSLIFPAPNQQEQLNIKSELNVANKIVALIQGSPQKLGELTYGAIQSQLEKIREQAYRERTHEEIVLSKQNREFALKQIEDLVEFQWVALPFDGSDYAETRQQLEELMAARKNTRNFAP
jgi:CRISPR-associated protein Cmr2